MILNSLILSDKSREIDEMDEEFQLMYLASIIVDSAFNFFKIERITSDKGKPPFELKDMIKLIFYGYINKITSSVVLAHNAKFNYLYNLISHAIEPKDRTIRDYREDFQGIFQFIMSFILIVANKLGLTDFEHIAIDGTIKKAYNSPFNIIKEKDISLLIRHYMVEELSKDEIKKLRRTARKFMNEPQNFDEYADKLNVRTVCYGSKDDSAAQAVKLFHALRQLDEIGAGKVYAMMPSTEGVGLAVYNRLLRAAGFRVVNL